MSSSIIAYLIPGLHLHFYFSTPLPDIVIIFSPLHDFHVLMVLKPSPNWWTVHLDLIVKGCQGVFLLDILGIWTLKIGTHGSCGEIKDHGGHRKEGGKIGNRR